MMTAQKVKYVAPSSIVKISKHTFLWRLLSLYTTEQLVDVFLPWTVKISQTKERERPASKFSTPKNTEHVLFVL